MDMSMSESKFIEMDENEVCQIDGGGPVAAVYALGFVMGMSPMGALIVV
jgi:hypothetical protein